MKDGKPVLYWDSDIHIVILEGDKKDPTLYEGSIFAKEKIEKKECFLVASLLVNSEVKQTLIDYPDAAKKFAEVLRRSNVINVATGRRVYSLSDDIIEICRKMGRVIKPPDAIHLATALLYEVDEFYTNDGKLLKLNGVLNVPKYSVPKITRPPLPTQLTLELRIE